MPELIFLAWVLILWAVLVVVRVGRSPTRTVEGYLISGWMFGSVLLAVLTVIVR